MLLDGLQIERLVPQGRSVHTVWIGDELFMFGSLVEVYWRSGPQLPELERHQEFQLTHVPVGPLEVAKTKISALYIGNADEINKAA